MTSSMLIITGAKITIRAYPNFFSKIFASDITDNTPTTILSLFLIGIDLEIRNFLEFFLSLNTLRELLPLKAHPISNTSISSLNTNYGILR